MIDNDRFWQAMAAGDPRFDGWVYCGVTSTGIYCRPSCPARTPKRENVRFFSTAASAQAAGYRACKRCRPDATPGSPEWDRRADLIGRAMRLIADGVVDREGVRGLASQLGYTERHVHRELFAAVGAGPLALARAQRAQSARVLLETTDTPITQIAFAAGFNSVRQFNATIRDVFAMAPRQLRSIVRREASEPSDGIVLRLPYRAPMDACHLISFLAARAVRGVEETDHASYRRTLRLPHGSGIVELRPSERYVLARFWLQDLRDLATAMHRCRLLLDLDCDPHAVADALGSDPLLGRHVRAKPGRRVLGTTDGEELVLRALLGQQISLAAAAALTARIVVAHGAPLTRALGTLTHVFPTPAALADADLAEIGMPSARRRALRSLASALQTDISVHPGADSERTRARLLELPGIGPWTVQYTAMRVLRDPDAFPDTDHGIRHAFRRLGLPTAPRSIRATSEQWRPYRAYAVQYLWGLLGANSRQPEGRATLAA